jgi:hypothetical protein
MNKTRTTKRACITTDPTKLAVTEVRIGPDRRGPAKCFKCRKPFKAGECWTRMTSPADPKHGTYSIGVHAACEGKRG